MTYNRTARQKGHDYQQAREFEEKIGTYLPDNKVGSLKQDAPDWVVPFEGKDLIIEVKEKNQNYTKRWPLSTSIEQTDQFIIDERTIRRNIMVSPYLWFLVRDNIMDGRIFLIPQWELICGRRVTVDRVQTNVSKGKWIIPLTDYRQIKLDDLWDTIVSDFKAKPWSKSQCVHATAFLKD